MVNKKIYISCPMSINMNTLNRFADKIKDMGATPVFWTRGGYYSQSDFDTSDAVVFLLPKNSFWSYTNDLPEGVKREFKRATQLGKKIFVGYITTKDEANIYLAKFDEFNCIVTGENNTTEAINKFIHTKTTVDPFTFQEYTINVVKYDVVVPDERVLLMLG